MRFFSKEEQEIKGEIVVNIRGGKTLRLPFCVITILPEIVVEEDKFDFGNITTLGNPGIANMTLVNNS